MVLKCADIGHLAANVATHKRWAYQLEEEFFRQVSLRAAHHAWLHAIPSSHVLQASRCAAVLQ